MSSTIPTLTDLCAAKTCAMYMQNEIEEMENLTQDIKERIKSYRETKQGRCDIELFYDTFGENPQRWLISGIERNTSCAKLKEIAIEHFKIPNSETLPGFSSHNLMVSVGKYLGKPMRIKETLEDHGLKKDGDFKPIWVFRVSSPCSRCAPPYEFMIAQCDH